MPVKKKNKSISKNKPLKKKLVKKPIAKNKTVEKKKEEISKPKKSKEKNIGEITHYFPQVRAAVIKLKAPLSVGDTIKIKGHTTDFTQSVVSMQIDRASINSAKKGQEIGLLVNSRVRQHDVVYRI